MALRITKRTLNSWINIPEAKFTFFVRTPANNNITVPTAKNMFCFILRTVALESFKAWINLSRLSAIKTTSAVSIAISVPATPIAIPTSAEAIAGASFTPSPTIARFLPFPIHAFTFTALSSGSSSAKTRSQPQLLTYYIGSMFIVAS